nr:hypothetical protein [uncultured Capnocytophaga sp.]
MPADVAILVANEHQIIIETGAGEGANFSDRDYTSPLQPELLKKY